MKKQNIFLALLVATLTGGNLCAQNVSKLKYVPNAFKTPNIPYAVNPKLPLQTRIKLANLTPALQTRIAAASTTQNANFPIHFSALATWIKRLPATQLTVPTPATIQAMKNLREKIYTYYSLSPAEQEELTQLASVLDKVYPQLKRSHVNNSQRLIYRGSIAPGEMPKIENFHLLIKQVDGIAYPFTKKEREEKLPLSSISLASNWNDRSKMRCVHFLPGHTLETLKQEFNQALQMITPPGYTVRMGINELGLKNNLEKFRQGDLHLHLEKINVSKDELPVDISTKVRLNMKYFAGEVDPKTRKVIHPFNDKKIANTYLILFGDYLEQPALQALSKLIYAE